MAVSTKKTIFAVKYGQTFKIAKGLLPFNPEGVAIEAGRLMLKRIDELLNFGEPFSIETTLATSKQLLKEYALHNDSLVVGNDKENVMDVPCQGNIGKTSRTGTVRIRNTVSRPHEKVKKFFRVFDSLEVVFLQASSLL